MDHTYPPTSSRTISHLNITQCRRKVYEIIDYMISCLIISCHEKSRFDYCNHRLDSKEGFTILRPTWVYSKKGILIFLENCKGEQRWSPWRNLASSACGLYEVCRWETRLRFSRMVGDMHWIRWTILILTVTRARTIIDSCLSFNFGREFFVLFIFTPRPVA